MFSIKTLQARYPVAARVGKALKIRFFLVRNALWKNYKAKFTPHWEVKDIPKAQRRPLGKPLNYYVETFPSTKEGIQKAYESGDYTMQQIADIFGVNYSTVSRTVNKSPIKQ